MNFVRNKNGESPGRDDNKTLLSTTWGNQNMMTNGTNGDQTPQSPEGYFQSLRTPNGSILKRY